MNYSFVDVESKWQKKWHELIKIWQKKATKGSYYCLDMFPYPSGSGLHVGHWRGYVLSDVYARKKFLEGYDVLHPMGWDAFGLPAENYAIEHKIHPEAAVKKNIEVFKDQLNCIGAVYDWSKEINTTDPHYYRWTQWIFLKMFQAGLAYQDFIEINWCPSCKTGLANEEAQGNQCERCKSAIEKKKIRQWVLRITKYAEQLLEGLDRLDWPLKVKAMQRNWIGKSEGLEIHFNFNDSADGTITVFTTRPETIYGVTFIAVSLNHPCINTLLKNKNCDQKFIDYIEKNRNNKNLKEEQISFTEGVFTGSYVIHPLTQQKIPVYCAEYVLDGYGTGALMGVPAHDERDYNFAKYHGIKLLYVIQNQNGDNSGWYDGHGTLVNSMHFDGLDSFEKGKSEIIESIVSRGIGKQKINYRMRDWIFSRQRYWGEPIPLIHCDHCGIVPVPEEQLPVELPYVSSYQPTGTGESPLADIHEWVNISCPKCSRAAKRETNTMPQWAGSCWYFLRYPSPHYNNGLCEPAQLEKYLPVNLYIGGVEHAILHLLYARFYVKFLYDEKIVPFNEPFLQLFNQGMVNRYSEKTGLVEKMSKSKGNVVNPNDLVREYGSDALRMYIIFMGPPEADCEWQDAGIEGCSRFLKKLWNVMTSENYTSNDEESSDARQIVHMFLKNYTYRIETLHTNTAVSSAMELLNSILERNIKLSVNLKIEILTALSLMCPHICGELLEIACEVSLADLKWPIYKQEYIEGGTRQVVVQLNGKTKHVLEVDRCVTKKDLEIFCHSSILKYIENKEIVKTICVGDSLVNFVCKEKNN
jgi:leucyl-tRNA synthetase